MYLRCIKKALPFLGFQKVRWCTRLPSAYSKKFFQWARPDFIAPFSMLSLLFFSLRERGTLKTVCPCLFQLLCLHLKSSDSKIQKYSYRNLSSKSTICDSYFYLKKQHSNVNPALISIAIKKHANKGNEAMHFTFPKLLISKNFKVSEQEQVTNHECY